MSAAPFIVDAAGLTAWQSCRRRYLLYTDFRPRKWRAHSLFDACLRRGVQALSSGTDPDAAVADAQSELMTQAANPGLDLPHGASPYQIAKDYAAMLSTVLTAISRLTLLRLSPAPPIPLNPAASWAVSSLADDSGVLHRWISVSALDDDTLARELHGWHVAGDVCVSRTPLTLHVVLIGTQRAGRRASPWARAWQHPSVQGRIAFRRRDGSSLRGAWTPIYLTDRPGHDTPRVTREWVDLLEREGLAEELIRHIPVEVPSDPVCDDTCAQIALEAAAMRLAVADRRSTPYFAHPMSRGACDGFVPCVWQPCCFSNTVVDPATLPLYTIKGCGTVQAALAVTQPATRPGGV